MGLIIVLNDVSDVRYLHIRVDTGRNTLQVCVIFFGSSAVILFEYIESNTGVY